MVEILLRQTTPGNTGVSPLATRGELLFIDTSQQGIWIALPPHVSANYASVALPDGNELRCGPIIAAYTHGPLTYIGLEADQIRALQAALDDFAVLAAPTSSALPTGDFDQGLDDYLKTDTVDTTTLRTIASQLPHFMRMDVSRSLADVLENIKIADVAERLARIDGRHVDRDESLFAELRDVLSRRRFVFIVGGVKSGLSDFVEQFQDAPATRLGGDMHIWADFEPTTYTATEEYVKQQGDILTAVGCDERIVSLYVSLAYAAYRRLLSSDGVNRDALMRIVPAGDAVRGFTFTYLNRMLKHKTTVRSNAHAAAVEVFLVFLSELMVAARESDALTVVLSFPSLMRWITDTQSATTATQVIRELWKQLKEFTEANYTTESGEPRPDGVMASFPSNVGVLVELRRVSFADLGDAFCKRSVMILPPLSDAELERLWYRRYQKQCDAKTLDALKTATRGAPWFVQFLLDACDLDHSETEPAARLEKAVKTCIAVMSAAPGVESGGLATLVRRWRKYRLLVEKSLSSAARTDQAVVYALSDNAEKRFKVPEGELPGEWFESGLFWLRSPLRDLRKHSLHALERFPFVSTYQQGDLARALTDSLQGL